MFLVDSHCHLDCLNYQTLHKDIDDVLKKAINRDVKFFLTIATNLINYSYIRKIVGKRNNVVFSCGVHPVYQNKLYDINDLLKLGAEEGVVAIGETGLDYYQSPETKLNQQISFRNHIRVSRELKKPIIVHVRNSHYDALKILKEEKAADCGGIIHCFTEDRKVARNFLDLGFYISLSGIVTFSSNKKLHDAVRYIPLNFILLETDSPYLSPAPHRGKENQPAMIKEIAECVAILKKLKVNEIAEITSKNFFDMFKMNNNLA